MFDTISNIAFWIGIPTVKLTENSDKKWIRVLGLFGMFPLFPLILPCAILLMVAILWDILETI